MKYKQFLLFTILPLLFISAQSSKNNIPQWTTIELTLTAKDDYKNPYTDIDVWAIFYNSKNEEFIRPAFWDGTNIWKVRFAPNDNNSKWTWKSFASNTNDRGLNNQTGSFKSTHYSGTNNLTKNGPLKMSKGHRSVTHSNGTPFLMVGDTPWAMPFRATNVQVEIYAKDRQEKGYNTALMMTVQPDMNAEGPNERNTEMGFKRAFNDLSNGHLNDINIDYFKYYDGIVETLINHEIVPVFQPVFHGFGWKGLQALGKSVDPNEYVRYCKYLLARYGTNPAIWLLGADHNGKDPGVLESGEMLEKWDCYAQPTGIHYNPCDDYLADWANGDREHCFHNNKSYQEKKWLDFQWAQTGHSSEHLYHKVEQMYNNLPTKAVANGEPTYEGMGDGKDGLGWWQGEEAWMQLMHGGTMGIVYGAATLWQWKITATEQGWQPWTDQATSWKDAMQMKGANYVGLVGKILNGYDLTDIEKRWELANGKPLLVKENQLYLSYLNEGGNISISGIPAGSTFHWANPKTGEITPKEKVRSTTFPAPDKKPWVLIISN
ncbi:DUF4038 domain-containing protein [Aurantibacter crassamenti]|uniref:apiosidase-like domain-containing protein n=1 Tax=Aurantibacter crassamenti TaxID=1837375 RepID=UPI00193A98A2|nr:DUF4038 domain-containing protein [Aurantibacter crassamenti]MBM1105188.1 DUF4038 domain-containing protein [Aurantibacter crassamenti]